MKHSACRWDGVQARVSASTDPVDSRRLSRAMVAGLALLGTVGVGLAAPASAQELKIGLASDPDTLDPAISRTVTARVVFAALCDKLVDIDPEPKIVPQLATSWSWAP